MTLESPTARVQYNGDGSTISFPVTFVFWNLDDPQVILTDSDGVETIWVRGTQYSMVGGSGSAGTLTVNISPVNYRPQTGEILTIVSDLPNTQPSEFPLGGPFPTPTLEQQLDQIVRQVQQLSEEIGRSIKLKVSSSESDVFIGDLSGNAAKFLRVNTAEDEIEPAGVLSTGLIGIPVPVNQGGTAAITGPGALTNLAAAGTEIINTFAKTQRWTNGGALTSASPLVIDTDGNMFEVTGTTGFSAMTVTAGALFILRFNGVLTMTDSANLALGGGEITTASGSQGLFYAKANNVVILLAFKHKGRKRQINIGAKIGATAGWTIQTNDDLGLLATCQASRTAATLIVPISGLLVGDMITRFNVFGQIESAGNTVLLDAELRKHTAATADVTDTLVAAMNQLSVTADTTLLRGAGSLTEIVADDETFYVLFTATTGALTDIALQGITLWFNEG